MKSRVLIIYSVVLMFYSAVIGLVILAGSHGKLLFANEETQIGLGIIVVFIVTSVMNIMIEEQQKIGLIKIGAAVLINVTALILLCYLLSFAYIGDGLSFILTIFQFVPVLLSLSSIFLIVKDSLRSKKYGGL